MVNILIYKSKEDSIQLGIQSINLTQVISELINWRKECIREKDKWCDPVRIAMIDSFEDIILNAIEENECLSMV